VVFVVVPVVLLVGLVAVLIVEDGVAIDPIW
jgi:hypothetical protein